MERVTVYVRGDVQGVGFRYWAARQARELGVVGYAKNLPDGRVELAAQGDGEAVERFVELLAEDATDGGRPGTVTGVVSRWDSARPGVTSFDVR